MSSHNIRVKQKENDMTEEKNVRVQKLVCPECNHEIKFTGDSDYDCGGGHYYIGECKECGQEFRIYEEENDYDLWYEVDTDRE